jgi:hypothetical protein
MRKNKKMSLLNQSLLLELVLTGNRGIQQPFIRWRSVALVEKPVGHDSILSIGRLRAAVPSSN